MADLERPRLDRLPDEETIRLALEAISDRDNERLAPLLCETVRVVTQRGDHEGREAVARWVELAYDHLLRRWRLDELHELGDGWLGIGRAEYVWREGGGLADSTPAFFSFRLEAGGLSELALHADEAAARRALETG